MARANRTDHTEQARLLHDHLGSIARLGQQLLDQRLDLQQAISHQFRIANAAEIAEFVSDLKAIEITLVSKIMRACAWAERLHPVDSRLAPMIRLFTSGTASVRDQLVDGQAPALQNFARHVSDRDYLVERGVLANPDTPLDQVTSIEITDAFRVSGTLVLGPILQTCSTFRDVLDTHYSLYEPSEPLVHADQSSDTRLEASEENKPGDDTTEGATKIETVEAVSPLLAEEPALPVTTAAIDREPTTGRSSLTERLNAARDFEA